MQVMTNKMSSKGQKGIYFPLAKVVRGYDPLDMVSLDPWRRTLNNMKFLQLSYRIPTLTIFLFTPRDPWKHRMHVIHIIALQVPLLQVTYPFSLFISAMASQQDNQGLHAQETQFREIFLSLSKGKEELRTLLMGNLARKSPEDDKDERLKRLQTEVDTMKTQMLNLLQKKIKSLLSPAI